MTEIAIAEASAELAGRRWVFDRAVLDERSLELFVDGERVEIERKPLEVLLYLLRHAGEAVTKAELAESLWPGRVLTESVLSRCISVLRQALKDHDRTLLRTTHGFGYRLVARVRIEASTSPLPTLDFKPGEAPPTRPQWRLVERLGAGGHGEAWLARHEKTGDARVFKFALDEGALSSLKREITLYRLLHDSLGARAPIARILEWNLEEPPYFIEMEHVLGGNLQQWSEAQGGLASVPLAQRLDLAAQIAEALAAAHSVGALHKDLKPGNVLVHVNNGRPAIRLCDFGSGTVLDPKRLEALGITRLGFTKTLAEATSATPLYIAPEVISGQPFTVQADIYSLGILLYQLVTGDLRKAMAPGWEADVEDELLREDIAAAAAGNPAKRLTDATQLAERLRTLEERRAARAAEAAARVRAERMRRAQEELKRARVFAIALSALTAVAVTGGVLAYRARNEAVEATATAMALSDFLMEDVLRIDSGLFRPSEASYEALLNRAATEAGTRLRDQPSARAKVHSLLGRRYQEIGDLAGALAQHERALALTTELYGESAEPTLMAMDRLSWIYIENGRRAQALRLSERMHDLWESQLAPNDPAMLIVRVRHARTLMTVGHFDTAEAELRAVLTDLETAAPPTDLATRLLGQWLGVTPQASAVPSVVSGYTNLLLGGVVLEEIGENTNEAETRLRGSLSTFSAVLGEEAELVALTTCTLANILAHSKKTDEAERLAERAQSIFRKSLPPGHYAHGLANIPLGRIRLEQQRFAEAVSQFQEAVATCEADRACPPRVLGHFLWELGTALNDRGHSGPAASALGSALELLKELDWDAHLLTLRVRVGLSDSLLAEGRRSDAASVLAGLNKAASALLKPHQQATADLLRAEGLLALESGDARRSVASLQRSVAIYEHRHGTAHWRSKRAQAELATARRALSQRRDP